MKNAKTYAVTWAPAEISSSNGSVEVWVGYCHYSKKAFTIAPDNLTMMVVQDIIVDDKTCEEGKRCLNTECPYNRTTYESYMTAKGMRPSKSEKRKSLQWKNMTSITKEEGNPKWFEKNEYGIVAPDKK